MDIIYFSDMDEIEVEAVQLNELLKQDQAAYEAWLNDEYNEQQNEQQDEQDEQF
jgi:hypothetical protein